MKFENHTHSGECVSNGTSLQGYVNATYPRLRELFGEPDDGDQYKVSTEWVIRFNDGAVATIYDWKQTSNYEGGRWTPEAFRANGEPHEWHIGGRSPEVVQRVTDLITGDTKADGATHYFASDCLGWAVGATRDEAVSKLAFGHRTEIKPAIANAHKAGEPGWYVWSCRVAGDTTVAYAIEWFKPHGVEISDAAEHFVTHITQKKLAYFTPDLDSNLNTRQTVEEK